MRRQKKFGCKFDGACPNYSDGCTKCPYNPTANNVAIAILVILFIIAIVVFIFIIKGCGTLTVEDFNKDQAKFAEVQKQVGYRETRQIQLSIDSYVNHFTYEGHSYIQFRNHSGSNPVGTIIHDPKCPCNTKER